MRNRRAPLAASCLALLLLARFVTCAAGLLPDGLLDTLSPLRAAPTNQVAVVDLLVVYTPSARAQAGGTAALEHRVELAVAEANTVYQNSAAAARLRLVHQQEIPYVESASNATNLARLQAPADGFMDEVHLIRRDRAADLVVLITQHSDPGVSGIAYTMGEPSPQFKDRAFSIVKQADLLGNYIFVHEISHNFGAQHDRENALDETGNLKPGSFPFSHGHRFTAEENLFRDVMAYAPGRPIPFLSNPDILYRGVPIGVAGGTNGANNALTVSSNALIASAFEGPAVKTAPPIIQFEPSAAAEITEGQEKRIEVRATDSDGFVARIEFYQGLNRLGIVTNSGINLGSPVYSLVWPNPPAGLHGLGARAIDNRGASSAALPIEVAVRPKNDHYRNRLKLTGASLRLNGSNRAATSESGEPQHAGNPGGKSVWYSWFAAKTGTFDLTIKGQDFFPLAHVYREGANGPSDSVTRVFVFDTTNQVVRASFDAAAGENYAIAVDGLSGLTGTFELTGAYQPPPAHDDYSNRQALAGETISLRDANSAATFQEGEPPHMYPVNYGGKSVWYSWTAPKSGPVEILVTATNFLPLLDVYLGPDLAGSTNVPQRVVSLDQTNRLAKASFYAVAGSNHSIAVDGFAAKTGSFELILNYLPPPPNDDFADRKLIEGFQIQFATSNDYATREGGEPQHAGQWNSKSIWYQWKAPASGPVTIVAAGKNFFALPDAYLGETLSALVPAPGRSIQFNTNNFTSVLEFTAVAAQTYSVAVDGFRGRSGPIEFSLTSVPPPAPIVLAAAGYVMTDGFRFQITGQAGQKIEVQTSTNLVDWMILEQRTLSTNQIEFLDSAASLSPQRFYRLLTRP